MQGGRIEKRINEALGEKGALLFMLIDPVDYKDGDAAVKTGREAAEAGVDVLRMSHLRGHITVAAISTDSRICPWREARAADFLLEI